MGSSRAGGGAGRKLVAPGEALSELTQQDRGSRASPKAAAVSE